MRRLTVRELERLWKGIRSPRDWEGAVEKYEAVMLSSTGMPRTAMTEEVYREGLGLCTTCRQPYAARKGQRGFPRVCSRFTKGALCGGRILWDPQPAVRSVVVPRTPGAGRKLGSYTLDDWALDLRHWCRWTLPPGCRLTRAELLLDWVYVDEIEYRSVPVLYVCEAAHERISLGTVAAVVDHWERAWTHGPVKALKAARRKRSTRGRIDHDAIEASVERSCRGMA